MKFKLLVILSTLTVLNLRAVAETKENSCSEIRGVFDIGSGSTKLKVFKWNTCNDSLVSVLDECSGHKKVSYKEDLKTSENISDKTLAKGLKFLNELKALSVSCGATKFAGAATSAFRQAKNGQQAAEFLMKNSGVNIEIVSQYQEAMLGFTGAKLKSGEKNKVCVWDIGGSSMQIICESTNGKLTTYLGHLASVPFKNEILSLQENESLSPNPIGVDIYKKSKTITSIEARKIKAKLGQLISTNKVIGIGGVHYYAVSKSVGQKTYTPSLLKKWILSNIHKSDKELGGGDFVDTLVSNVVLVEGLMTSLSMESVKAYKVNLTDGVLASPRFWNR